MLYCFYKGGGKKPMTFERYPELDTLLLANPGAGKHPARILFIQFYTRGIRHFRTRWDTARRTNSRLHRANLP